MLYPKAMARYEFINRDKTPFVADFARMLRRQVDHMADIILTAEEREFLLSRAYFLPPPYIDFLSSYRFNPGEVKIAQNSGELKIVVEGPWYTSILWEVPLMAMISELHFIMGDKNWAWTKEDRATYKTMTAAKMDRLLDSDCLLAEFGTRRRRSFDVQQSVMEALTEDKRYTNFVGTSNVYFAMKFGVKAIGTIAHEFVMAMQSFHGITHCNKFAMEKWNSVFGTQLGIMLPDTMGIDIFLADFDKQFADLYSGVRHDSGPCNIFVDKIVEHYQKLGIDPMSKFLIFSDALSTEKAIEIRKYCQGKINCSFGIGTNLTNDFAESRALNMVIKLHEIDGMPVVKISDSGGKETGDRKTIEYAKYLMSKHLAFSNQNI
jgi:nicotinate phosphoribosyltransferase